MESKNAPSSVIFVARRLLSRNTLEHLDVLLTGSSKGMSSMTPSAGERRSSDRLALTGRWANPKIHCVREKAAGIPRSVRREGFDRRDRSVYRSVQGIWNDPGDMGGRCRGDHGWGRASGSCGTPSRWTAGTGWAAGLVGSSGKYGRGRGQHGVALS